MCWTIPAFHYLTYPENGKTPGALVLQGLFLWFLSGRLFPERVGVVDDVFISATFVAARAMPLVIEGGIDGSAARALAVFVGVGGEWRGGVARLFGGNHRETSFDNSKTVKLRLAGQGLGKNPGLRSDAYILA